MSQYTQMSQKQICHQCALEVTQGDSYMICGNYHHVYHKKCLKTLHQNKYDQALDAGYIYNSGKSSNYKNHRCPCGKSLQIHNKFSVKAKVVMKHVLPLLLIIALV